MAKWTIDSAHSEVTFKIKHLVISSVSGKFKSFDASIETDKDDFTDAKVQFTADVDSIDTGNAQRDGHLKSPDFFDAANYPKISFVSTQIAKKGGHEYLLKGNLTMRNVTKPVELSVEFGGINQNFQKETVAGFEINGKLNRKDFNLSWNGMTETGSIVVGDDVKIHINAEMIKKG
jgi:polyisoprenoid-binding protein YceI